MDPLPHLVLKHFYFSKSKSCDYKIVFFEIVIFFLKINLSLRSTLQLKLVLLEMHLQFFSTVLCHSHSRSVNSLQHLNKDKWIIDGHLVASPLYCHHALTRQTALLLTGVKLLLNPIKPGGSWLTLDLHMCSCVTPLSCALCFCISSRMSNTAGFIHHCYQGLHLHANFRLTVTQWRQISQQEAGGFLSIYIQHEIFTQECIVLRVFVSFPPPSCFVIALN